LELVWLWWKYVFPCGIGSLDEFDLLCSCPAFEFLLASDCTTNIAKIVTVDEAVNVVLRYVGAGRRFAVSADLAMDVICYADVEVS
jgi:hypothetical protein